jgi:hypothetical protein
MGGVHPCEDCTPDCGAPECGCCGAKGGETCAIDCDTRAEHPGLPGPVKDLVREVLQTYPPEDVELDVALRLPRGPVTRREGKVRVIPVLPVSESADALIDDLVAERTTPQGSVEVERYDWRHLGSPYGCQDPQRCSSVADCMHDCGAFGPPEEPEPAPKWQRDGDGWLLLVEGVEAAKLTRRVGEVSRCWVAAGWGAYALFSETDNALAHLREWAKPEGITVPDLPVLKAEDAAKWLWQGDQWRLWVGSTVCAIIAPDDDDGWVLWSWGPWIDKGAEGNLTSGELPELVGQVRRWGEAEGIEVPGLPVPKAKTETEVPHG